MGIYFLNLDSGEWGMRIMKRPCFLTLCRLELSKTLYIKTLELNQNKISLAVGNSFSLDTTQSK